MTYPGQPAQGADPYAHVDDFFGGGIKSLHFDAAKGYQRGQWKGGKIVDIRPKQPQTDMKTKKPIFWDDDPSRPKYTLPVIVQTAERDPSDPHDDGKRTMFIDGLKEKAVRDALRAAGPNVKLRPGGDIWLAWTTGAGEVGDAKQYAAQYTPAPPAGHADADAMLGAPQQQYGAPQQAPQQQYAPPASQQPYGAPPAPAQQYASPAAPPVAPQAAPQQPDLWQQPAPVAQPQWPAQPPAAPPAAPPAPVAPPAAPQQYVQPAAPAGPPAFDLDVAYAHLTAEQRAALRAANMSPEQIAAVYGAPRAA